MSNLPAEIDDDSKYFMYEMTDGVLCKYDMRTGELVDQHARGMIEVNSFKYTLEWSEILCGEIRKGKSLSAICAQVGFPSIGTVHKWKAAHPDLKRSLQMARQDRAESYADLALEIAMSVTNKDDAQVAKVQIDTLKWSAEKGNPSEYGQSQKITGDANAPVGFSIISTGIEKGVQRDVEIEEKNTIVETSCTEVPAEEEL